MNLVEYRLEIRHARNDARKSALREAAAICNEYVQIAGVIDSMSSEDMDAFRKGEMHAAASLEDAILGAMKEHGK